MASLLLPRWLVAQHEDRAVEESRLISRPEAWIRIIAGIVVAAIGFLGYFELWYRPMSYPKCVSYVLTGWLILNTGLYYQ